jgi:hypothetical protein
LVRARWPDSFTVAFGVVVQHVGQSIDLVTHFIRCLLGLPICSVDFLLRWPRVASVWSAPGSSLVMTPPPSLGPALISRCCFCELGSGLIQSPMNPWSPVGAIKAESSLFLARASAVTSAQASLNFSHASTVLGVRSLASDSQWIFPVGSTP